MEIKIYDRWYIAMNRISKTFPLLLIPLLFSCSTFNNISDRMAGAYSGSSSSAPAANRLDFTTELDVPGITLIVTGNPMVTWYLSDGTTNTGNPLTYNFGSSAHRAHYVTIDPPGSLVRINAASATGVSSITGLSNFPNLAFIFCYLNSYLTSISLAGCHSVNQLHLDDIQLSKTDVDQLLIAVDEATGDMSGIKSDFYYMPRTTNSDAAYSNLIKKGWSMWDNGY